MLPHVCSSDLCRLRMQHRFAFNREESTGAVGSCRVSLCVDVKLSLVSPSYSGQALLSQR